MISPTIAIIGGGFTGLVAALRLAENGAKVTVLESGKELGGLASCFEMNGEPMEKAYHHLFRTDEEILQLILELGIEDRLEWRESSVAIYRDGQLWPFRSPGDLLKFGACSLFGRIRLGFAALVLKYRKDWQNLVDTPAIEWMRRYCGKSATKAVWEPLLNGKFSSHAGHVSMAWLWARLHIRSNSREPGAGGERLGYIRGGFIQIIIELESRLRAAGVIIQTDTRVESLAPASRGVTVTSTRATEDYDAVLFTGSNNSLHRLMPETGNCKEYRAALQKIDYLGAVCMIFETDQRLGDFYWVNVNEPDWPFLVMIRHTKLIPAERYGGKEIYYLGAYLSHDDARFTMDQTSLEELWFGALKRMFPEFSRSNVGNVHCFRFRDAQHVVDCHYAAKIMPYDTPIHGLYLSNFAQIFPQDRGTNYAVREGEAIARHIIQSIS